MTEVGRKFDTGKSPVRKGVLEYFPRAILTIGLVSGFGAEKYDWNNWEHLEDAVERYGDAEIRHICEAAISGDTDADSGLAHAAHEAWNALAVLELKLREKEVKEKEAKQLAESEAEGHRLDSFRYMFHPSNCKPFPKRYVGVDLAMANAPEFKEGIKEYIKASQKAADEKLKKGL